MDADGGTDIITALRSDLAGLQYKREKLISEVMHFISSLLQKTTISIFILLIVFLKVYFLHTYNTMCYNDL